MAEVPAEAAARSEDKPVGQVLAGHPWHVALAGLFLLMIFAVPMSQVLLERARGDEIQELRVFEQPPTRKALDEYERGLERGSYAGAAVRRDVQWAVFETLGAGSEKCVVGRDGTLFYRPSLNSVIAPSFTSGREVDGGADGDGGGQPMPAILRFRDSLARHGVRLLLLIVPGKESIYPEWLTRGYDPRQGPPRNPAMGEFQRALTIQGVELLDSAPVLWAAKGGRPLYLREDTHWTPEGLAVVADALAERLSSVAGDDTALVAKPEQVTNHGDLYDMLGLPSRASLLEPEAVTVQRVVDRQTGAPVQPDESSPIVLLGDSFTNIYSVAGLAWGDHGGLGEQLALRLGRRVDVIALNDGGVNTSRGALCRRPAPLEGKQVVVWQFAERDLVVSKGNWKIMEVKR